MKAFKFVFLVVFIAVLFLPYQYSQASQAQEELKITMDKILEILSDPSLKGEDKIEEKRASLRKAIKKKFSFSKMSQLSLGRHWKKRNDEEKKIFSELFGQLLEQTYISKIESYTDEKIIFVKDYVKKKKAQVNTKIITDTIEIPIDYRMYKTKNGTWLVYDIVVEGVSLVGNYRSQFNQILQKGSYEKLVEDIRKKVDK